VVLPLARELTNYSTHVEEAMASLHGKLTGRLRIACSTSAGKYILPLLIARFRQQYPEVRVNVGVCTPEAAVEQVCDRRSHLGVLSREADCRDVEYRRFFTDHVVLIVPQDHAWAERESEPISPLELVGEPFIMREESSGSRQVLQAGLLEHQIRLDDLDVVMELGSAEAIASSVEAGVGISFVSRIVARRCINVGYVVEIPVKGLELQREINMIRPSRRAQTHAQMAFWEFVHAPDNEELLRLAE
jgi:DNA-binding transcriptional LysR family regulator